MMGLQRSGFLTRTCIFLLVCALIAGCHARPDPVTTAIIASMAPVLTGQGVPQAAAYDPAAPGPHRLVILNTSGRAYKYWNEDLPVGWLPASVSETELVVVVGEEQDVSVAVQVYKGGTTVTAYQHKVEVVLREARTGLMLASAEIFGSRPPPFPYSIPSDVTRISGSSVYLETLEEWLCQEITCQEAAP